jgi:bifunctional N-acetylglucosamine-1-phosphate-uridyltransferase/glucosamine-1-phosphate-acetyltransferase GlmU-like protein
MGAGDPTVVVLAAGLGTRFGGAKPLAAIGADGTAILDLLIRRAAGAGFAEVVLVVAPGMEDSVRSHVDTHRDPAATVPAVLVVQQLHAGRETPAGTADAVLATREVVRGSFAVVNADDLYPADAFARLGTHLRDGPADEHALVAFRVAETLLGDRPVSRALVDVDDDDQLMSIREGTVTRSGEGLRFDDRKSRSHARALALAPDRIVSMNMWGFRTSVFAVLERTVNDFLAADGAGEVYLPDVVAAMVGQGSRVRVLVSDDACLGVTHPEDVVALRQALP